MHQAMEYLDISTNSLGNKGFKSLYGRINRRNTKLKVLRLRDNKIGGDSLNGSLRGVTRSLKTLDLQDNMLTD